jgi:hypothetical protein
MGKKHRPRPTFRDPCFSPFRFLSAASEAVKVVLFDESGESAQLDNAVCIQAGNVALAVEAKQPPVIVAHDLAKSVHDDDQRHDRTAHFVADADHRAYKLGKVRQATRRWPVQALLDDARSARLRVRVVFPAASKDIAQLSPHRAARNHLHVVPGHPPKTEDGKANDGYDHRKEDDGSHAQIIRTQPIGRQHCRLRHRPYAGVSSSRFGCNPGQSSFGDSPYAARASGGASSSRRNDSDSSRLRRSPSTSSSSSKIARASGERRSSRRPHSSVSHLRSSS